MAVKICGEQSGEDVFLKLHRDSESECVYLRVMGAGGNMIADILYIDDDSVLSKVSLGVGATAKLRDLGFKIDKTGRSLAVRELNEP